MSLLRYYNLTKGVAAFPGCTGTLASGEARSVVVDEIDMDSYLENLSVRGPVMGLAVLPGEQGDVPSFTGGTQRFAWLESSGALGAEVRSAVLPMDAVTATLMAASAVPADALVRVLLDHTLGGATTGSVARAGADTIDGGAGPVALTPSAPLVTLRSDGVSAWVTV
jgi:hypothetical protein